MSANNKGIVAKGSLIEEGDASGFFTVQNCIKDTCTDLPGTYYRWRREVDQDKPVIGIPNPYLDSLPKDPSGSLFIQRPIEGDYNPKTPFYLMENPTMATKNGIQPGEILTDPADPEADSWITKMKGVVVPADYCPNVLPCKPEGLCCPGMIPIERGEGGGMGSGSGDGDGDGDEERGIRRIKWWVWLIIGIVALFLIIGIIVFMAGGRRGRLSNYGQYGSPLATGNIGMVDYESTFPSSGYY